MDKPLNGGFICEKHGIGYIRKCPTCAFLENPPKQYVVCSSHLIASKVKGDLPDVIYKYIAYDSMIPGHYTFTRNLKDAYYFDDFEIEEAKEAAYLLNMKIKKLDS